ncbi:MAG: hypothetical protein ACO2Z9_07725 [Crocinitomicaceae bacterium]
MKVNVLKFGVFAMAASLTLASCRKGCTDPTAINYDEKAKKEDNSCEYDNGGSNPSNSVVVSGAISTNTTWTASNVYELAGKVVVEAGVTLTIEPGTIIKGQQGSGTLASALIVAQGAMIDACATAAAPIIFTSELDNIQPGQITGTNLTEGDQGLWGGVIILGNAPISAADGDALSQIEGIPTSDTFGAFGGTDAADNSGCFSYVSIRHGGALIGAGNEINGLTLGGVGSGTTISNVEVVANLDDGVEFFGGTVDASNILVGFQGDDGIDIDMNYAGTVSDFLVVNGANSDEALEIDGPEGTTYTNGMFTLLNGTCNVFGGGDAKGDFKSKAQGTINNVDLGTAKIRASYQNACADPKNDAFTNLTDVSPTLTFTSSAFSAVTVYTASDDGAATPTQCTVPVADQTAAEGVMTSGTAAGGPTAWGWTWMHANNKL